MAVFTVCGENPALWQWDLNRRIAVEHPACHQVHFCSENGENALVCQVYQENESFFVDIPNVLLQTDDPLKVYAFVTDSDGKRTAICETFVVNARPKPQDYIYTETETWSVEKAVGEALLAAKENGDFKGDPGPKGDPGVVKFVVVTQLPTEDTENAIYLLPNEEGTGENLFDEYIFVNGKWEKIGSAAVAVNLDEYVKKTDAATMGGDFGLIRLQSNPYYTGITINPNGMLSLYSADGAAIRAKSNYRLPITPSVLDGAVKEGVIANKETLTDEEKTAACAWLGAVRIAVNPDGMLAIRLADGSKYRVNAEKEVT